VEREAREVAADYPETPFLMGSSGGPEGDNFGVFGTRNHEAAYLAGMLAGTHVGNAMSSARSAATRSRRSTS
jgi:basic membrane protein A